MNKVILLGRLAKDPQIRRTQSGKAVASMTIAVNRTTKKPDGGYDADFIPLVAWERTASFAEQYLHKGTQVLVEGRMEVRKYTAQDGTDRWATEVRVSNIEFAGPKQSNNDVGHSYSAPTPQDAFNGVDTDEEIPF